MQCSLKCRIVLCAEWQISRYLYRCLFHDVYSSLGERISTYLESCPKRSSGVGGLSKCCCQCISYLFRRNFEHSCDQVTVAEVALIQVPFPNVDYKQKIKMNTHNTMASSCHSKISSTQNMGVLLFSCLGQGV